MVAKDQDLPLPQYRPSGAAPLTIVPAALAAAGAGVLLGLLYGVVSKINPFIVVDIFLVFALGIAAGVLARVACQIAHCRNRLIGLVLGVSIGLLALGGSYWMGYKMDTRVLSKPGARSTKQRASSEATFRDWVQARKESGWIVRGGRINGAAVPIVWLFEAFFVLAFASVMGWQAGAEPYCEHCHAWPKHHKLYLKGHNADEFWRAAKAGAPLEVLQASAQVPERTDVALVLDGLICDKCHNGFLNVDEEIVSTQKGRLRTVRKPLVHGVVLDHQNCETFLGVSHESIS